MEEMQDHHVTPQSHGWVCTPNNPKQEFTPTLDQGLPGNSIHSRQRWPHSRIASLPSLPPRLLPMGPQEGSQPNCCSCGSDGTHIPWRCGERSGR